MKTLFGKPLGFLTFTIILGLVVPLLVMDGMFMDATMYTAVGHNLANGYGSPWFLFYSITHTIEVPGFFENPPLGYWIFAIFFKLFGDSLYVERFYLLLVYLSTMLLIIKLWKLVIHRFADIAWLPLLLWGVVPLTFWAYTQNMMENTMTLFILISIILAWKSARNLSGNYGWAALSGFFVFLAFMVKGFPGIYPLVTIALYWLVYRTISFKRALGLSLIMLACTIIPMLLVFTLPISAESMGYYLFERTFGRVGSLPTVDNRFHIVWDLIQQLILPLILVLIAGLIFRFRVRRELSIDKKAILFLSLLGLCGVLPLALTKVQRGFYLIPAIPILAMALSVSIAKAIQYFQENMSNKVNKIVYIVGGIFLIITVVASITVAGKPKRDKKLLADIHTVGNRIGKHDTIAAPESITQNWGTKGYFMRYYFIQLDHNALEQGELGMQHWLLMPKNETPVIPNVEKQEIDLYTFDLYKRYDN